MILPAGINKAKGLKEALKDLHMSMHNVVAVWRCRERWRHVTRSRMRGSRFKCITGRSKMADWVTDHHHGKGVIQLIDRLFENDLHDLDKQLTRHYLPLGRRISDEGFGVSAFGPNILLSGTTKSGKSTFTTYILEQMIEKHYQFCLIDPEGDYVDLPGVVRVGDNAHAARAGRSNFIIAKPHAKHYRLYTGRSARRPAAVLQ